MATIGYIRVSTVEQNTDRQLDGLQFDKTFTEKCSGGSTNRPALEAMLEFVREGDTVKYIALTASRVTVLTYCAL